MQRCGIAAEKCTAEHGCRPSVGASWPWGAMLACAHVLTSAMQSARHPFGIAGLGCHSGKTAWRHAPNRHRRTAARRHRDCTTTPNAGLARHPVSLTRILAADAALSSGRGGGGDFAALGSRGRPGAGRCRPALLVRFRTAPLGRCRPTVVIASNRPYKTDPNDPGASEDRSASALAPASGCHRGPNLPCHHERRDRYELMTHITQSLDVSRRASIDA